MPEVVLPEPVSPVMSQPRQKSLRFQDNPFNRATRLLLGQNRNNEMTSQTLRVTTAAAVHDFPGQANVKGSKYGPRGLKKFMGWSITKTSRSRSPLQSPPQS